MEGQTSLRAPGGQEGTRNAGSRELLSTTINCLVDPRRPYSVLMPSALASQDVVGRSWDKLPTPPSSGGADDITVRQKHTSRRVHLCSEAATQNDTLDECSQSAKKRACRRPQDVLTPPSTRGRRMTDKLGLHAAAERHQQRRTRHVRQCSDVSEDPSSLLDDMDLFSTSGSWKHAEKARDTTPPPFLSAHESRPVRDTPHNPFVEGGPADVGFTGMNASNALLRAMARPARQPDTTVFVFRGQRVMYRDAESRHPAPLYENVPSPPRPCKLFPAKQRTGMPSYTANRHVLSDNKLPPGPSTRRRNLFAEELSNPSRRARQLPAAGHDVDACWLASDAPADDAKRSHYEIPAKNRELLARLERVDWDDEEDEGDT